MSFDIDAIKELADLVAEVQQRAGEGEQSGQSIKFSCPHPDHVDSNPSFTVNLDTKRFKCWSQCGKSGDVIDLLVWLDGLTPGEAMRLLAEKYDIDEADGPRPVRPTNTPPPPKLVARPHDGCTPLNAGASEQLLSEFLRARAWPATAGEGLHLSVVKDEKGLLRIRFPYVLDGEHEEPLLWQDRATVGGQAPKWLTPLGATMYPFGIDCLDRYEGPPDAWPDCPIIRSPAVWLVEGPTDAAALIASAPGVSVLGVPGANAWKERWAPALAGLRVVVVTDSDEAGQRLRDDIVGSLVKYAEAVQVFVPQAFGDIDEWCRGSEDVVAELRAAYDLGVAQHGKWVSEFGDQRTTTTPTAGLRRKDIMAPTTLAHVRAMTAGSTASMWDEVETFHRRDDPVPASEAEVSTTGGTRLFVIHSMKELLAADLSMKWSVRGVLCDPTYGQLAGAMKTFKSYIGMMLDLALATGTPFLGEFLVDRPGPVVRYIGEGGQVPWTRRAKRIAKAMGITLADADYHPSFDVAPIGSERFMASLHRDLDEFEPVLFHLDPYYAYHGADVDSRNLLHEGALLASLSVPCMEAGASCLVTNHFNQTGRGTGLDRITQAGSGEWVDTWIMLSHREPGDLATGTFKLKMEIGSRQWGGSVWDLDLHVGTLNPVTGEHVGDFGWDLRRHQTAPSSPQGLEAAILDLVMAKPWMLTETEVANAIGGNNSKVKTTVKGLVEDGLLLSEHRKRHEGPEDSPRERTRWLLGPVQHQATRSEPAEPGTG